MFSKLLVPLDGSPLAERALQLAGMLAKPTGAKLVLVRAAQAHPGPGTSLADAQVAAVSEAETYLEKIAARLAQEGVSVETAVPYGEAVEAIAEEVRLRQADLVVMATHGRSGIGRLVYGSVAKGVLVRSGVPVLLVRAWRPESEMKPLSDQPRIVVPLDGSAFSEEALPVAVAMARGLNGRLVLVRAVWPPDRVLRAEEGPIVHIDELLNSLKASAQDYLAQVASRLDVGQPIIQDVRTGDPSMAIIAACREHGASMVVMTTHGRTGLARVLFGSVAGSVLRRGNVPLLLVRPASLGPAPVEALTRAPAKESSSPMVTEEHRVASLFSPWETEVLAEPTVPVEPGGSHLERLLESIEAFRETKSEKLGDYGAIAETSGDPMVALLMHLMVEDEERHRRLLQSIAASLRDGLYWTHSAEALPTGAMPKVGGSAELLAAVRDLIRHVHEGGRHLREMGNREAGLYDGMFQVLLEAMAKDSEKHELMLRFIERRLEASTRGHPSAR